MERLQKVLAHAGVASRRHCEELIAQGKVQVNGQVVREKGIKVDPLKDKIVVNGQQVKLEQHVYLLLYKPTGVITSVTDPRGRRVVIDLLKGIKERVYPVGRLDYDTSGLLLLTNDGELANRLAHPSYEIDKVYRAWVKGIPSQDEVRKLATGIRLEDGMTSPGQSKLLKTESSSQRALVELTIHEGRNRQVRRMCEAIGHPVLTLERIRLGFLTLDGLKPGEFRKLTQEEVESLKQGLVQKKRSPRSKR
ncbi:pseudouridine synthase [Brevibacillus brevis]|uniref:Pseudouridine synthase n=1 Tax=Brevibacillus brevis TaxID=1393 RepID=A0A517I6M5_BREBE|nr:pseudouridine synthase [Brevibacillus brevis]QDS34549.1 rRNA pseudouridine synthase [Brevibacillus brevis]